MMTKRELRKMLRQQPPIDTAAEASSVIRSLLKDDHVRQAHTLLLYSALPDELPLQPLIDQLASEGRTILLPRVVSDTDMELHRYTGTNDLQRGAYGILEPIGELFTAYDTIDVVIVPGMAFDRQGHRLGRGKGYYDRFLPQLTNAYKIGVCPSTRLIDQVPTAPHDALMDRVVTLENSGLRRISL